MTSFTFPYLGAKCEINISQYSLKVALSQEITPKVTHNHRHSSHSGVVIWSVSQFLSQKGFANICKYMAIFSNICQYLSIFANICQYMPRYGNICKYLPILVNICQSMAILANICQSDLVTVFEPSQQITRASANCHGPLWSRRSRSWNRMIVIFVKTVDDDYLGPYSSSCSRKSVCSSYFRHRAWQ